MSPRIRDDKPREELGLCANSGTGIELQVPMINRGRLKRLSLHTRPAGVELFATCLRAMFVWALLAAALPSTSFAQTCAQLFTEASFSVGAGEILAQNAALENEFPKLRNDLAASPVLSGAQITSLNRYFDRW